MAPKTERTLGDLLFVFRDDSVARLTMNFFVVLNEDTIVKDRHPGRRDQLVSIKLWRLQDDLQGLPLTWRTRDVYQGRCLTVDGSALAIRIQLLVKGVEDLDLE